MEQETSTFKIENLTDEEQAIREQGIELLFRQISKTRSEFSREAAEKFYDKMQQAAIDEGDSVWKFYRKN